MYYIFMCLHFAYVFRFLQVSLHTYTFIWSLGVMCPTNRSNHSFSVPCSSTEPIFTQSPPRFSMPNVVSRLGSRLRRSNTLDKYGFHPWNEYGLQDIHTNRFMHKTLPPKHINNTLVDYAGFATSFPCDLALRWIFQSPEDGETKVIYARDTELRWTEIIAGARSGFVPTRYVSRVAEDGSIKGPMTREWFIDMVSQFEVNSDNKLTREGLEVCMDPVDFEWKAIIMLEQTIDNFDLAFYTPDRLVNTVRKTFQLWHLDSYNRACAIIDSFNAVSPLPFDHSTSIGITFYARLGLKLPAFNSVCVCPPPRYEDSSISSASTILDLHSGHDSHPFTFTPEQSSLLHFPLTDPEDSIMDSEDGI